MRAGVREFLVYPFAPGVIEEAFSRAHSRGGFEPDRRNVTGKSFLFLGAKGGSGATTAACNLQFRWPRSRTQYSFDRSRPSAGRCSSQSWDYERVLCDGRAQGTRPARLAVFAATGGPAQLGIVRAWAPGKFLRTEIADSAIDKLIMVASKSFENVVVDAGSRWELAETRLFDFASTIYLVTQVGISELRNANRLIIGCLQPYSSKLEIVLNRYKAEMFGIGAETIDGALTRQADWRIPNDYSAVREMQDTAVPLALKRSGIQQAIQVMARIASGLPAEERKKRFSIFGLASET